MYKCKNCGHENKEWYCERCDDGGRDVKREHRKLSKMKQESF